MWSQVWSDLDGERIQQFPAEEWVNVWPGLTTKYGAFLGRQDLVPVIHFLASAPDKSYQ